MSRRILVVDDDADVRTLVTLSLSRVGGHEVRSVSSGSECLAELARWDPDVVVLDVMMPAQSGPATLAEIRSGTEAPAVLVVFLTASVAPSDVARLLDMPVSGVLAKPFDPMLLPGELAALLGW